MKTLRLNEMENVHILTQSFVMVEVMVAMMVMLVIITPDLNFEF